MPDLQPDLSMYPKAGSSNMSLGDLLSIATHAQEYQGKQSMTDALKSSGGDPATALKSLLSGPGFKDPGQVSAISQMGEAQIALKQHQMNTAAAQVTRLLDLGPKVTRKDVAQVQPILAGLLGPQAAAEWVAKLTPPDVPDGAPLAKYLQLQKNVLTGGQEPTAEVPGPAGSQTVPAGRRSMALGTGQGGMPPTGLPKEYEADLANAGTYTERTAPLVNVLSTLKKTGPHDFGPGTDELNTIKKLAGVAGVDKQLGIDLEKADNYDRVKKALTDYTNRISEGGTDLKTLQTIDANPNITMQKATIQSLAKVNLSLEARRHAMTSEFGAAVDRGEYAPSEYRRWKADFAQKYDPRAFAFPMMNEDAQRKLLKGMSAEERGKFERSYAVAKKYIAQPPEGGWYTE